MLLENISALDLAISCVVTMIAILALGIASQAIHFFFKFIQQPVLTDTASYQEEWQAIDNDLLSKDGWTEISESEYAHPQSGFQEFMASPTGRYFAR